MKILRLLIAVLFVLISVGCASNNYVIKIKSDDLEQSGTVFGRITLQRFFGLGAYNSDASFGRGISFKNQNTGKFYGAGGVKFFVLQLPEGIYELVTMGVPAGYLAPKDKPFSFSVEKGSVKYIGAVVGDRDLKIYLEELSKLRPPTKNDIKAHRIYGLGKYDKTIVGRPTLTAGEPYLHFFVVDESPAAIKKFVEEYPEYNQQEIVTDLMN